jgi:hypothetical protein
MRPPRIPFHERKDIGTTILAAILTVYFGLTAVTYCVGIILTGGRDVSRLVLTFLVLGAAAGISLFTAIRIWTRRPDALRWGWACLAMIIAIWMKWPIYSGFFTTSVAAACLIWLIY